MKYLFFALTAVILLYLGIYKEEKEQSMDTAQEQWETKIDEQPPVTIRVTPMEFGQAANQWKFNIVFTTHAGSLDDDPVKIAFLTDDEGNSYRPISWEGPGPGGHHREGILIFNPIELLPEYVELKIKDVGGVVERTFKWSL